MKLFETTITFAEVLSLKIYKGETVHHELTNMAWDDWQKADLLAFERHEDYAYATIDTTRPKGYVVTIQVQPANINLQKAREEYIAMEGNRCPACLCKVIEGARMEAHAGGAHQEITCSRCGSTWTDQHSLVRIDDLIIREGKG